MRWSKVNDAANPANVPRQVHYRDQLFMPLESCSAAQARLLDALIRETGSDADVIFGDGFETVDALSSWAASWAITELHALRERQEHEQADVKRLMGGLMRQRMAMMPVRRCNTCDGDRPHRSVMSVLVCSVCEATP